MIQVIVQARESEEMSRLIRNSWDTSVVKSHKTVFKKVIGRRKGKEVHSTWKYDEGG